MQDEYEDKKTVWAYILKNGTLSDGDWNQYHGNWSCALTSNSVKDSAEAVKTILGVGVNWSKTNMPSYQVKGEFMDSESPPSNIDTLFGTIQLQDGQEFIFGMIKPDSAILDELQNYNEKVEKIDHKKQAKSFW